MRFFNTEGPTVPALDYHIPPLSRIKLPNILHLFERWRYFVLHAPRQTGKTSTLRALRDHLNANGNYRCVYANFESGQASGEDTARAMQAILGELSDRAEDTLGDSFVGATWPGLLQQSGPDGVLNRTLSRWAGIDPKPLVLFIDEIDSLVGITLISVLRQLGSGYDRRPKHFPQSVILCGVRDVRDYRIRTSSVKETIAGGSAFNIKAKSLRLGDFTKAETRALLQQHTEETGQAFAEESLAAIWDQTQGQP